jgi:hypothetical protein
MPVNGSVGPLETPAGVAGAAVVCGFPSGTFCATGACGGVNGAFGAALVFGAGGGVVPCAGAVGGVVGDAG